MQPPSLVMPSDVDDRHRLPRGIQATCSMTKSSMFWIGTPLSSTMMTTFCSRTEPLNARPLEDREGGEGEEAGGKGSSREVFPTAGASHREINRQMMFRKRYTQHKPPTNIASNKRTLPLTFWRVTFLIGSADMYQVSWKTATGMIGAVFCIIQVMIVRPKSAMDHVEHVDVHDDAQEE